MAGPGSLMHSPGSAGLLGGAGGAGAASLAGKTGQANPARLASDSRGLDSLRHGAAKDPKAAALDAARAFESLFMNELLKSMRAATESAGLMDNAGTKLGTELLDAQLAS